MSVFEILFFGGVRAQPLRALVIIFVLSAFAATAVISIVIGLLCNNAFMPLQSEVAPDALYRFKPNADGISSAFERKLFQSFKVSLGAGVIEGDARLVAFGKPTEVAVRIIGKSECCRRADYDHHRDADITKQLGRFYGLARGDELHLLVGGRSEILTVKNVIPDTSAESATTIYVSAQTARTVLRKSGFDRIDVLNADSQSEPLAKRDLSTSIYIMGDRVSADTPLFAIARSLERNVYLVAVLALLAATCFLLQFLLANLRDRRQSIAILRSFGVVRGSIRNAILFESIIYCVAGFFIGSVFAGNLMLFVVGLSQGTAGVQYSAIIADLLVRALWVTALASFVLGVFAGLLVGVQAATIRPQALRAKSPQRQGKAFPYFTRGRSPLSIPIVDLSRNSDRFVLITVTNVLSTAAIFAWLTIGPTFQALEATWATQVGNSGFTLQSLPHWDSLSAPMSTVVLAEALKENRTGTTTFSREYRTTVGKSQEIVLRGNSSFTFKSEDSNAEPCSLTPLAAHRLGVAVGSHFEVQTMTGRKRLAVTSINMDQLDSSYIDVSYAVAAKWFHDPRPDTIRFWDADRSASLLNGLEKLRLRYSLLLTTPSSKIEGVQNFFRSIETIITGVALGSASIAFLASALGFSIILLEQRKPILLLRIIGASWRLSSTFSAIQVAIVGSIGLVCGTALGFISEHFALFLLGVDQLGIPIRAASPRIEYLEYFICAELGYTVVAFLVAAGISRLSNVEMNSLSAPS